jgi:hypothetical protein
MQPFRQRKKRINGVRNTDFITNKPDRKIQTEWKGHVDGMSNDSIQSIYKNVIRKEKKV